LLTLPNPGGIGEKTGKKPRNLMGQEEDSVIGEGKMKRKEKKEFTLRNPRPQRLEKKPTERMTFP